MKQTILLLIGQFIAVVALLTVALEYEDNDAVDDDEYIHRIAPPFIFEENSGFDDYDEAGSGDDATVFLKARVIRALEGNSNNSNYRRLVFLHSVRMHTDLQKPTNFKYRVVQVALDDVVGLRLVWQNSKKNPLSFTFDCAVDRKPSTGELDESSLRCSSNKASVWTWAKWHLQMSDVAGLDLTRQYSGNRTVSEVVRKKENGWTLPVDFNWTVRNGALADCNMEYDASGSTLTELTPNDDNDSETVDDNFCRTLRDVSACTLDNLGRCIWIHSNEAEGTIAPGCVAMNSAMFVHKDDRARRYTKFSNSDDASVTIESADYSLATFQGEMRAVMTLVGARHLNAAEEAQVQEVKQQLATIVSPDVILNDNNPKLFGPRTYKHSFNPRGQERQIREDKALVALHSTAKADNICTPKTDGRGMDCTMEMLKANILNKDLIIELSSNAEAVTDPQTVVSLRAAGTFSWLGLRVTLFSLNFNSLENRKTLLDRDFEVGRATFQFGPATIRFVVSIPIVVDLGFFPCPNPPAAPICVKFGPESKFGIRTTGEVGFGFRRFGAFATIEATGNLLTFSSVLTLTIAERDLCVGYEFIKARTSVTIAIGGRICLIRCRSRTFFERTFNIGASGTLRGVLIPTVCVEHPFTIPSSSSGSRLQIRP